jgi:UDP-N-acetyl-D-mannosaminuronate dehydrogenase
MKIAIIGLGYVGLNLGVAGILPAEAGVEAAWLF